jgi:hypothetical protein
MRVELAEMSSTIRWLLSGRRIAASGCRCPADGREAALTVRSDLRRWQGLGARSAPRGPEPESGDGSAPWTLKFTVTP